MPKKIKFALAIFFIVIQSMAIIGYIANIFAIWQGDMSTNILALRVAGVIIAPLGAVLGWF
jgi:hypothetical protein